MKKYKCLCAMICILIITACGAGDDKDAVLSENQGKLTDQRGDLAEQSTEPTEQGGDQLSSEKDEDSETQFTASSGEADKAESSDADKSESSDADKADSSDTDTKSSDDHNSSDKWILFKNDEIMIELMAGTDISTGNRCYPIKFTSVNGAYRIIYLEDVKLNGNINIGNDTITSQIGSISDEKSVETEYVIPYGFQNVIANCDEGKLTRFSASLKVYDENPAEILSTEIDVNIREDENSSYLFEPYMGAVADEQLILDNDVFEVRLLGMGCAPANGKMSDMYGVMRVKNKSSETKHFNLFGMSVNDVFTDLSFFEEPLDSGDVGYFTFSYDSWFEYPGMKGINRVSLLISTYYGSLSGSNLSAESWLCPIELSSKIEDYGEGEQGDLLYESDECEIRLIDETENEDSLGYTRYEWKLLFKNKTDDNIKLAINESWINGKKEERESVIVSDTVILTKAYAASNTSCYMTVIYNDTLLGKKPDISFTLDAFGLDKDTLMYRIDVPVKMEH